MARRIENPDRDFSTDPQDRDSDSLRELLKRGEVADISDPLVRERVGETIVRRSPIASGPAIEITISGCAD